MNWYKKAKQDFEVEDIDCPECGGKMIFMPEGRFGPYYRCENNCGVTHGATKTGKPKGVTGDLETISLRKAAHKKFDELWQSQPDPKAARTKAYEWLSRKMGCHKNQCHMAQFNKEQLRQAIGICEFALNRVRQREADKNQMELGL